MKVWSTRPTTLVALSCIEKPDVALTRNPTASKRLQSCLARSADLAELRPIIEHPFKRSRMFRIRILVPRVSLRPLLTQALGVFVQPGKDAFELAEIRIRDSLKELTPDLVKKQRDLRRKASASTRWRDDLQPSVLWMAPPRQKTTRFEPVDEAGDLSFVSAHDLGEFSSGGLCLIHATQKHSRFLRSHPEGIETVVKDRLQPDAHPEEPGNGKLRLPFPNTSVFHGLPPSLERPPSKLPALPSLSCLCHSFGRYPSNGTWGSSRKPV